MMKKKFDENFFRQFPNFKFNSKKQNSKKQNFKKMIIKIVPPNEKGEKWVLLELQGQIKAKYEDAKLIGKLSLENGYVKTKRRKDEYVVDDDATHVNTPLTLLAETHDRIPVLIIAHNRLEGSFLSLKRPLALLKKSEDEAFEVSAVIEEKIVFKNRPRPLTSSSNNTPLNVKKRRIL